MQLQRLFEIIYTLLYKKHVTAKELAEHFEVSTRTIYRDIDTLSAAGIPIYTNKGKDGGIFIMDHYVLNRSLLSDQDQKEILSALQGVGALDQSPQQETTTLDRMRTFFQQVEPSWIEVDLSDWSNQHQSMFQELKHAIWNHNVLQFQYYSTAGTKQKRTVNPLQLWFKDRSWYLRAYCREKESMRTFKISRMQHLITTSQTFEPTPLAPMEMANITQVHQMVLMRLHIQANMAYRVFDEFSEDQITRLSDGSFEICVQYPLDQWVYGNLLSYGASLRVLEPDFIRDELKHQLQATLHQYGENL